MHEALAIRERERERLIGLARLYVEELGEFQAAWRGGNPLAREATAAGVQLSGGPYFESLGPAAVKPPRPR